MQRTGTLNVIMAGQLPTDRESLDSMPSAKRIMCKWELHEGATLNYEGCLSRLMAAKELAATDTRIEGFLVDDFSTGSINAGVKPEHLAQLQFANATYFPHLPLNATIYIQSLERPELPAMLPYFDELLVPLWYADKIDTVPAALDRLSELSGGKPMMLCLYVFDFGNGELTARDLMQRQLDVAEQMVLEERVTGLLICGTCMMDLDWESNHTLYEWLDRVGDRTIG